ncbi:MAG: hypothetical protein EPN88_07270 [Bacteroidetes bacterium]|nr:MAG: hypothetical protein EPN88_07270 [Bacteroidota bacterium]
MYRYLFFLKQQNSYVNDKNDWSKHDVLYSWWDKAKLAVFPQYHPFLGWSILPLTSEKINIDNTGIRTTVFNPPVDPSKSYHSLAFFGGSTIWGELVSDENTIPSLVSSLLNKTTPSYQVTNYGQVAYTSNQELMYFIQLLKENTKFENVVFYSGCNDFVVRTMYTKPAMVYGEEQRRQELGHMWIIPNSFPNRSLINPGLMKDSVQFISTYIKIIHYPIEIIKYITGQRTPKEDIFFVPNFTDETYEKLSTDIVENYYKNTKIIDALAKSYNFKYTLVWQPILYTKKTKSSQEEKLLPPQKDDYAKLTNLIRSKLADKKIPHFYDFSDIFNTDTETIFADVCHITMEGNQILSDKLIELVKK